MKEIYDSGGWEQNINKNEMQNYNNKNKKRRTRWGWRDKDSKGEDKKHANRKKRTRRRRRTGTRRKGEEQKRIDAKEKERKRERKLKRQKLRAGHDESQDERGGRSARQDHSVHRPKHYSRHAGTPSDGPTVRAVRGTSRFAAPMLQYVIGLYSVPVGSFGIRRNLLTVADLERGRTGYPTTFPFGEGLTPSLTVMLAYAKY